MAKWPMRNTVLDILVISDLFTAAENKTCHEECTSRTNCWGPDDHQCDVNGCLNFQYKNRCVPDCSNVSLRLGEEASGVHQNEVMKLCEDCDTECVGGCQNGTVSNTSYPSSPPSLLATSCNRTFNKLSDIRSCFL